MTLKNGGSVLIPCYPSGVVYDLFECLSTNLDNHGFSQIPMFFISPVADSSLAYSNILAEWLSSVKQNKVYIPDEPFPHASNCFFFLIEFDNNSLHCILFIWIHPTQALWRTRDWNISSTSIRKDLVLIFGNHVLCFVAIQASDSAMQCILLNCGDRIHCTLSYLQVKLIKLMKWSRKTILLILRTWFPISPCIGTISAVGNESNLLSHRNVSQFSTGE